MTEAESFSTGKLILSNIQGQEVFIKEISSEQNRIDIESLKTGFYFLRVQSKNHNWCTQKIYLE